MITSWRERYTSHLVLLLTALGACDGASSTPAGDASVSGDTSAATDAPAVTPTATDAIVRMCLMNNACGYQTIFLREADRCVSQALNRLSQHADTTTPEHRLHFQRMVECARTARTCQEYVRCADFGVNCAGTVQPRCDGTVRNACSTPGGNFQPRTFDCALFAGGACTGAQCLYPSTGAACTSPGQGRCDGATRVWCRASGTPNMGTEVRDPCPSGTQCYGAATYGTADPACVPPMNGCAAPSLRCEGDTVVMCANAGGSLVEARVDCAAAGRRCGADDRGRAACVPAATECAAATTTPTTATCEGTAIRVCIEGRVQRIDCTSVGMTGCAMPGGSAICN